MAILSWKWKFWNLLVRRRRPLWCHWRPLCGIGNFGKKILDMGNFFPKFWKLWKFWKFWFEISKVGSKFWRWEGYIDKKLFRESESRRHTVDKFSLSDGNRGGRTWWRWADRPWRNRLKSQSGCDLAIELLLHRPLFWWASMSTSLRRHKNLLIVESNLVQAQPFRRLQLPLSTNPLPRVVLVWLLAWPFIWLKHPTQVWSTGSTWF